MQRSVFSWSLILAVTVLWSTVSSGVEDKNGAVPIGSLCAGCHSRIKEVMSSKSWTLTDSLATSYGVLSFNIFKFDIPKPQVLTSNNDRYHFTLTFCKLNLKY